MEESKWRKEERMKKREKEKRKKERKKEKERKKRKKERRKYRKQRRKGNSERRAIPEMLPDRYVSPTVNFTSLRSGTSAVSLYSVSALNSRYTHSLHVIKRKPLTSDHSVDHSVWLCRNVYHQLWSKDQIWRNTHPCRHHWSLGSNHN